MSRSATRFVTRSPSGRCLAGPVYVGWGRTALTTVWHIGSLAGPIAFGAPAAADVLARLWRMATVTT